MSAVKTCADATLNGDWESSSADSLEDLADGEVCPKKLSWSGWRNEGHPRVFIQFCG